MKKMKKRYKVISRPVILDNGLISNDVVDYYIEDIESNEIRHWGIAPSYWWFVYNSQTETFSTPFGIINKQELIVEG